MKCGTRSSRSIYPAKPSGMGAAIFYVSCDGKAKRLSEGLCYWSLNFAKMLAFFRSILDWIKSLFWKEEMELTLVGLQYSGKTTFVNVIAVSVMYESFLWSMPCSNLFRHHLLLISLFG